MKNLLILFSIIVLTHHSFGQQANIKDFTYYSKYDKRLVSHKSVQRHVFSIGTGITGFSSEAFTPITKISNAIPDIQQQPLLKIGIGYHYFFLKSRKLNFFNKERYEHTGFSFYVNTYWSQINQGEYLNPSEDNDTLNLESNLIVRPQNELRLTYTNPFLSFRGKMINFYLLHEYGLSLFNSSLSPFNDADLDGTTSLYINFVPLSIKLGTKPIYFKTSFNFALDNQLLQRQRMKANGGIDIQIYFYRTKKK